MTLTVLSSPRHRTRHLQVFSAGITAATVAASAPRPTRTATPSISKLDDAAVLGALGRLPASAQDPISMREEEVHRTF
jgi:hypothetical protein